MKFYEIDNALTETIRAADKAVRLKIDIELNGYFQTVFEQDIIEANFYSLKEAAGGVSSRGEVLIDNSCGFFSDCMNNAGTQVKVSFSLGEGLPYFQRFVFYVDEKGIQDIRGNGRKKLVCLDLRDLSYKLRKTDEARDWTSPAVFTYSVICDKTQAEKSLVHCIAQRAGLKADDMDCSTIPVTLPYVRLRRNIWAELSSMATAYRCHLECTPEKPLVFACSPYQKEPLQNDDCSYTFTGDHIFYLRKIAKAELYRNTVRLKVNMPVALEKQEIWQYDDPPVFYDGFLQAHFPFKYPLVRDIENGNYEAKYRIVDVTGKERNIIFADEIDTKEEAENRLDYDGGAFSYTQYDITTNHDKAILKLSKKNDGDLGDPSGRAREEGFNGDHTVANLYKAAIHGRPIVLDLNRSCFLRDNEAVNNFGTAALNVTGSYFSEYEIDGKPHYEDWAIRELAERLQNKQEFTVKTHRALFNARVGANVKIKMKKEEMCGEISALSFRYKRDAAFIAAFKIKEQ